MPNNVQTLTLAVGSSSQPMQGAVEYAETIQSVYCDLAANAS